MIGANVVIPSYQAFGFSRAQWGVTLSLTFMLDVDLLTISLTPLNLLCFFTEAGHKSCSATPIIPNIRCFIVLVQIL